MTSISIETTRDVEALDITDEVQRVVGAASGVLWISTPHTTAALVVNEADPAFLRDLERTAALLLRPLEPFTHARGGNRNSAAHLAAALFGRECLMRVAHGELGLGKHQRLLMLELDGPKRRCLHVQELSVLNPR